MQVAECRSAPVPLPFTGISTPTQVCKSLKNPCCSTKVPTIRVLLFTQTLDKLPSSDSALPSYLPTPHYHYHYHYLVEEEGVEEDTAGQGNAFTTSWSAPSSLFFFVLVVLPNKTSWGHFSVPYGRTMLMIDRTTSLTTSSPSSFPSNTCQCLL